MLRWLYKIITNNLCTFNIGSPFFYLHATAKRNFEFLNLFVHLKTPLWADLMQVLFIFEISLTPHELIKGVIWLILPLCTQLEKNYLLGSSVCAVDDLKRWDQWIQERLRELLVQNISISPPDLRIKKKE